MGAAQIAAIAAVRPTSSPGVRPQRPEQRRGNNPPAPKPPPAQVQAPNRTERRAGDEIQRLKNELIELRKTTNQQLLTEVKFLRGKKTELEGQVAELKKQVDLLKESDKAMAQLIGEKIQEIKGLKGSK